MKKAFKPFALLAILLLASACGQDVPPEPAEPAAVQQEAPLVQESEIQPADFSVVGASFSEMQAAMADGTVTAVDIVQQYLDRIERYENKLRAAIAIIPDALEQAAELDRERAAGNVRGPLHGIPIALKDNIHTTNMPTTGGALAFKGYTPPYEATLVKNLREAGAIIIAKTTLTELANWVATGMPNNFNPVRGYGMNPYDPRPDPRDGFDDGRAVLDTGGSSSGIGTAASLWAASVGTETSGSIQIPSNNTMLVGIKPTVGRISRHGIIPITADQDTAGPMAKYVADAAALLAALESVDPDDDARGICDPPPDGDYSSHLRPGALDGARIGLPRTFFYAETTPPGASDPVGGLTEAEQAAMRRAIDVLIAEGAEVVDPADIPSVVARSADDNQLLFGNCYDLPQGKDGDDNCSVVMKYGMKRDFNEWLDSLGDTAPVESLTGLREFNLAHREAGAIPYDQAELDISDEMDVKADRERYQADRQKDIRLSRTEGIDAVLEDHNLDALLMPSWKGENILNKAGYPAIIVPFTRVPLERDPPLPAGFGPEPMPFGVAFIGGACDEPRLIELAYAFEQATQGREPPPQFP